MHILEVPSFSSIVLMGNQHAKVIYLMSPCSNKLYNYITSSTFRWTLCIVLCLAIENCAISVYHVPLVEFSTLRSR